MPLFARVFVTVLDSSIAEDFTLRHVFEDLFKLCDWRTGVVDMTRQAIARRLNIPLETINSCIDRLEAPDPASRDPDHGGRRLQRLDKHRDWGWRILNWQKYDAIRNRADVAQRVQRHRDLKKAANEPTVAGRGQSDPLPEEVKPREQLPPMARVRASNRPGSVEEVIEAGKMLMFSEVACRRFWNHYEGTAKEDEEGRVVWVTGEKGEKQVGNWRNILATWKAGDDAAQNQAQHSPSGKRSRPRKEAEKEPGPPVKLNVITFTQEAAPTPEPLPATTIPPT